MEIREGIKFKFIYAPNTEFVLDKIEKNNLISRDNGKYKYTFEDVIAYFKKDIWKLTYYPYKEGDYCIRTWPSGKKTLGVAFSFIDTDLYFKSLEDYNGEGGVTKNSVYGLLQEPFRGIYQRPAFKDEIPKESIMNKEELLMEAKRRYPIGTRIKCLFEYTDKNAKFATITKDNFYFSNDSNNMWVQGLNWILCVYKNGKWAEIIENKTENMNDLDKELKERESKLNKNVTNSDQVLTLNLIASEIFKPNNKIKPNLIKHNNSRFQKLLIIRTNKSKHSGKTK